MHQIWLTMHIEIKSKCLFCYKYNQTNSVKLVLMKQQTDEYDVEMEQLIQYVSISLNAKYYWMIESNVKQIQQQKI